MKKIRFPGFSIDICIIKAWFVIYFAIFFFVPRYVYSQTNNDDYKNTLEWGAAEGNLEKVKKLVQGGADIDGKEKEGGPLSNAIMNKRLDVAYFLLERGADPNKNKSGGGSALIEAIIIGDIDLIKILIIKGADVNYNDYVGVGTPLIRALEENFQNTETTIALLLEKGADPCATSKFQTKPSILAKKFKKEKIYKLLKSKMKNCEN